MAEQQFREIQLSGKQLVFLFMTTVVLAVAVFLLGVSVGRGTRTPGDAVVEQTAEVVPPADLPPPTEITPADLQYYDAQKEQQTPPPDPLPQTEEPEAAGPAAAPPSEPAAAPEPEPEPPPALAAAPEPQRPTPAPSAAQSRGSGSSAQAGASGQASTRASQPSAPAPAAQASSPAGEGWTLQGGAYSSRANADRQVQLLRAKGYNAFVLTGGPGNLRRVRVGPLAERAEADRIAAQLAREEGLKSSLIR